MKHVYKQKLIQHKLEINSKSLKDPVLNHNFTHANIGNFTQVK